MINNLNHPLWYPKIIQNCPLVYKPSILGPQMLQQLQDHLFWNDINWSKMLHFGGLTLEADCKGAEHLLHLAGWG